MNPGDLMQVVLNDHGDLEDYVRVYAGPRSVGNYVVAGKLYNRSTVIIIGSHHHDDHVRTKDVIIMGTDENNVPIIGWVMNMWLQPLP